MINLYIRTIGRVNRFICDKSKWLSVLLVLLGAYEVFARFILNRPTEWGYEMLIMVGGAMYVVSWGDLHSRDLHVKVDVIYAGLSFRTQRMIDILCGIFVHLPLMIGFTYVSYIKMIRAWAVGEKSILTTWYPSTGPVKTAVFLGVFLFLLQVIAKILENIQRYRNGSDKTKGDDVK